MANMGLDGRVALVTGANHGIGAATAEALAIQGAAVFVTYLRLQPTKTTAAIQPMPAISTSGPTAPTRRPDASTS